MRGSLPVLSAARFTLSSLLVTCCWAAKFNGFDVSGTLVKCHTTAAEGRPFIIEVKRDWAPLGTDRFLKLVESGYFTDVPFFRVVPGFLTQFGITPDKALRKYWREQGPIQDDPSQHMQIKRGYLSFAGGGPNTRDMQLFIALADSDFLGKSPWEVPIGRVVYGMDEVIDQLYPVGEIHPFDKGGVKQGKIWEEGNAYLQKDFPRLDYFTDCAVIGPTSAKPPPPQEQQQPKQEKQLQKQEPQLKQQQQEQQEKQKDVESAAAAPQDHPTPATRELGGGGAVAGQAAVAAAASKAAAAAAEKKKPAGGKRRAAAAAVSSSAAAGRLTAAVEERIAAAAAAADTQRPESAMWGAGTLCLIVGSIALFTVLLYRMGKKPAAVKAL